LITKTTIKESIALKFNGHEIHQIVLLPSSTNH